MPDVSDMELLRDYCRQGSDTAFAGLVERHISLVHSAALRQVGIAAHAEEITQAVFVILAHKAAGLRPDTVLDAWLYETTRLTSLNFLRRERRRQWREQEAYMQSTLPESTDASVWNQLAPLLDEAMARLGKKDREAVVLRFFKERKLAEVAAAMKITEAAAQSRVHRALEKLRKAFLKRGVHSTTAAIGETIAANSIQAAPAGLATSISNAVLSVIKLSAIPAATTTMTILQKIFTSAATVTAVGTIIYAAHLNSHLSLLQRQNASLADQIQQLQQERDDTTNQLAALADQNASLKSDSDELLRLRAEVTQLHQVENVPPVDPPATQTPPIGIHLKGGFYFIPDQDLQNMGIDWTTDSHGGAIGYLEGSQLTNVLDALNGASDVTCSSVPQVVMINNETATMSVTRQIFLRNPALTNFVVSDTHQLDATNFGSYTNVGEIFNAKASYSAESSNFDLNFKFELKDLTGDPSLPTVQTITMTNNATFAAGKTFAFEQPLSAGSWLPDETNFGTGPRDLIVFFTPQVVDLSNFQPGRHP